MSAEAISEVTRTQPMSGSNIAGGIPENPSLDVNDARYEAPVSSNTIFVSGNSQIDSIHNAANHTSGFVTPDGEIVDFNPPDQDSMKRAVEENVVNMIALKTDFSRNPAFVYYNGNLCSTNYPIQDVIGCADILKDTYGVIAYSKPNLFAKGSEPKFILVLYNNDGSVLEGEKLLIACQNSIPEAINRKNAMAQV